MPGAITYVCVLQMFLIYEHVSALHIAHAEGYNNSSPYIVRMSDSSTFVMYF